MQNRTKGYKNHPQLIRFRSCENPIEAIGFYLSEIVSEAIKRGYHFDDSKIEKTNVLIKIPVTLGQILYEKEHLRRKLMIRDENRICLLNTHPLCIHPLFYMIE